MVFDRNVGKRFVLALDVANQVTQFGLAREGELLVTWSLTTPKHLTEDEAQLHLETFVQVAKRRDPALSECAACGFDAILSCVVPDLGSIWIEALTAVCGRRPLVVGPGLKTGIPMKYNDPSELGSDRVAGIVAAKEKYGSPLIAANCDTVITYQVLDEEGAFIGGFITPGLALSAQSLAREAARLPLIDLAGPVAVPGKNTQDSLKAGIVCGEKARIQGLVRMMWENLGYETPVILSGKDADTLASLVDFEVVVEKDLVLQGLAFLFAMNRK